MFLGKNKKNMRSRFTAFAILGLAITVLWSGASSTNAQVIRVNDFVGDNKTDFVTLTLAQDTPIRWKITGNPAPAGPNQAFIRHFDYGVANTDFIRPGDYVGDSKTEPTVYRVTDRTWYVANFPFGAGGVTINRTVVFGASTDTPNVGDYDGDGKHDFTTVRVASNLVTWYILGSVSNTFKAIRFGSTAGLPTVPAGSGFVFFPGADFTGDGRDELVFLSRNSAGVITYQIGDSNTGASVITRIFGNYDTDLTIPPGDYTGDGRADFVTIRQTEGANATWYIGDSQTTSARATKFGLADPLFTDLDLPVRGDYDGDGRQDICIYRDSNATFYWINSSVGIANAQQHGNSGDFPLGSLYQF